jgi:hypothetical protein
MSLWFSLLIIIAPYSAIPGPWSVQLYKEGNALPHSWPFSCDFISDQYMDQSEWGRYSVVMVKCCKIMQKLPVFESEVLTVITLKFTFFWPKGWHSFSPKISLPIYSDTQHHITGNGIAQGHVKCTNNRIVMWVLLPFWDFRNQNKRFEPTLWCLVTV